ncbi:MAG: SRPBCC family protein [Thermomicrobiaceae bacterium]|nr:SRPBCC family protein [Thermomicrobiaceae bacterium]
MARIDGEIVIHRPVDEVFDVVADERNEPRYNPEMLRVEKISPGPIGAGAEFRAVSRARGDTTEMTIEYTEYIRPRRLASVTHLPGMEIDGALTFDPVPDGTRLRWSWDVRPRGRYKLMTPLIARLGRRNEERCWAGLKAYLEARDRTPALASTADDTARARPGGREGADHGNLDRRSPNPCREGR